MRTDQLSAGTLTAAAALTNGNSIAAGAPPALPPAPAATTRKAGTIELAALLHRGEHVARTQQHLSDVIRDLLAETAESGDLRDDVAPAELASYCLHALTAAGSLPSEAAVRRLVTVTLAGLRPAPAGSRHGR